MNKLTAYIIAGALCGAVAACGDDIDNSYFDGLFSDDYNQDLFWDPDSLALTRIEWKQTDMSSGATVKTGTVTMWGVPQKLAVISYAPSTLKTDVKENTKQSSLADMSMRENALFAINGAQAEFLLVDGEVKRDGADLQGKALIGISDERMEIGACPLDLNRVKEKYNTAMVGGDLIVKAGRINVADNDSDEREARSVIGIDRNGQAVMLQVDKADGTAAGATLYEAAFICWAYGFQNAVALESGAASTIWTREDGSLNVPGGRLSENIICVMRRPLFELGDGSEGSPYIVSKPNQLPNIRFALKATGTTHFKLDCDMDMRGITDWTPVNTNPTATSRIVFDGDHHTISNFKCTDKKYASFFGILYGECRNVRFENAEVTDANVANDVEPDAILAAYVGSAEQTALVEQVSVQGTIKSYSKNVKNVGPAGIAGQARNAVIHNCYADVNIEMDNIAWDNAGGALVAVAGLNTRIECCWATGEMSCLASCSNHPNGGGIAGMVIFFERGTPELGVRIDRNIGWMRSFAGFNGYCWNICGFVCTANKEDGCIGTNYAWSGTAYNLSVAQLTSGRYGIGVDAERTDDIIAAARTLGWSESIWNLSGDTPKFVWE